MITTSSEMTVSKAGLMRLTRAFSRSISTMSSLSPAPRQLRLRLRLWLCALIATLVMMMTTRSAFAVSAAPISPPIPSADMISYEDVRGTPYNITRDGRSFFINDQRILLQSGSLHYTRSTPDMWPDLLNRTRAANLNMIQVFFFWNYHEISQGVYDWETESRNLGKFLQLAADAGLFVFLRIGPFACGEWNYGGIPIRLRQEKGIVFRYYEPHWMNEMVIVMTAVIQYVEPYLARNGGPIIMSQIENEYAHVAAAIGPLSDVYVQWCVNLTQTPALNVGILWVMDSQPNLVDTVINAYNGFYGEKFAISHSEQYPDQPAMWTEHYPGWFQHWGEARPHRPVEDLTYATIKYIACGGAHYNYYMWHGGTSFGRSAGNSGGLGIGDLTSYGFDAPLDEYGWVNPDKYGHVSRLHAWLAYYGLAITSNPRALPQATSSVNVSVYQYGAIGTPGSILFVINTGVANITATYLSYTFDMPAWSASVVDGDTMTLQYNSATVEGSRVDTSVWKPLASASDPTAITYWYYEPIGFWNTSAVIVADEPLEQLDLTLDTTDFLLYETAITLNDSQIANGVVQLGLTEAFDWLYIYIDDVRLNVTIPAQKTLQYVALNVEWLKPGTHTLLIYSQALGLRNSEAHQELVTKGLCGQVLLDGVDLRKQTWKHQVNLQGLALEYFAPNATVPWISGAPANGEFLWYRIDAPALADDIGTSTFQIDMSGMGKGYVWVNGRMLGRYWNIIATQSVCDATCDYVGTYQSEKCRYDCGKPSLTVYHLPASWVVRTPGAINSIVVLEEIGGDPMTITIRGRFNTNEAVVVAEKAIQSVAVM